MCSIRSGRRRNCPKCERMSAAAPKPQPWRGWFTLLYKELLRFWKVSFQTIAAPILTALLYLVIFSHVLETRVAVFDGRVGYTAFLVPGLVMMSILQNAFANSSSSLIQSKIVCNVVRRRTRIAGVGGGPGQSRTGDTRIFSAVLYQLSYRATGPGA